MNSITAMFYALFYLLLSPIAIAEDVVSEGPDPSIVDYVSNVAVPLPGSDGSWIDPFVGDHRVVLVGEETHGIAEHIHLKAEIARRLVTRHGFTHVLIEDDVFKADALDANVRLDSPGPSEPHLRSFFWCWNVAELRDFFDSLPALGLRPRVGGIDVQTGRYALTSLRDHVETESQRALVDSVDTLLAMDRAEYAKRSEGERRSDGALVERLRDRFAPKDVGRECRHLLRVLAVRAGGDDHGPRMNARDRGMAESIDDILSADPTHKAVVFAHNAHAGYEPFYQSFTGGVIPVGAHLREAGVATLSIGVVFATGSRLLDPRSRERNGGPIVSDVEPPPDGQAAVWATVRDARWLIDLRRIDVDEAPEPVRAFFTASPPGYFNNYGAARPLGTAYDLLVGYRSVTAATPIERSEEEAEPTGR